MADFIRVDLHKEVVSGLIDSGNPPSRSAASDTNKQSHHRLGPTEPTHPRIECGGRLLLNRNDISELYILKRCHFADCSSGCYGCVGVSNKVSISHVLSLMSIIC